MRRKSAEAKAAEAQAAVFASVSEGSGRAQFAEFLHEQLEALRSNIMLEVETLASQSAGPPIPMNGHFNHNIKEIQSGDAQLSSSTAFSVASPRPKTSNSPTKSRNSRDSGTIGQLRDRGDSGFDSGIIGQQRDRGDSGYASEGKDANIDTGFVRMESPDVLRASTSDKLFGLPHGSSENAIDPRTSSKPSVGMTGTLTEQMIGKGSFVNFSADESRHMIQVSTGGASPPPDVTEASEMPSPAASGRRRASTSKDDDVVSAISEGKRSSVGSADDECRTEYSESTVRRLATFKEAAPELYELNRGACCRFGAKGVIHPFALSYRLWAALTMVVVVVSSFFIPLRYAFLQSDDGAARVVDILLVLWFGIDMLLTFNVAVVSVKELRDSRRAIAMHYMGSLRFWTDLAAIAPFFLGEISALKNVLGKERVSALGLIRLVRVHRLLEFFRELQKSTALNLLSVVVAKFVLFILLGTHTAGCIFYALARIDDYSDDTWVPAVDPNLPFEPLRTRYLSALFWAVGSFKAGPTSGFHVPTSEAEIVWACFVVLLNICLQTYLVSSMAALLTQEDSVIYAMRKQIRMLRDFARRHSIPDAMADKVHKFLRFKFSTNQELESAVLDNLPELYRQRIHHHMYEDLLRNAPVFNGTPSLFLRQLHGLVKSNVYMPDSVLLTEGEPTNELLIIAHGYVKCFHHGRFVERRKVGDIITAMSFMCGVGHFFTVRSSSDELCRTLGVARSLWDHACTQFPMAKWQVWANIKNYATEHLKTFKPNTGGWDAYSTIVATIQERIAQLNERTSAELCTAAAKGDIGAMKQLIAAGASAAMTSNRHGWTPLHAAAINGRTDIIRLLLDRGADPNGTDEHGQTPLLAACRARKLEAARVLHDNGAYLHIAGDQSSRLTLASTLNSNSTRQACAKVLCAAAADPESLWFFRALLEFGADPNAADHDGRTALHISCVAGNRHAVHLLLQLPRCLVSPMDKLGRTPLFEAVRHAHLDCAKLVRAAGGEHGLTEVTDEDEPPPPEMEMGALYAGQILCQAAFLARKEFIHDLVKYAGVAVDSMDYDGRTALMLACAEGHATTATTLHELGASIHRTDRWGHNALVEARKGGHKRLASLLESMETAKKKAAKVDKCTDSMSVASSMGWGEQRAEERRAERHAARAVHISEPTSTENGVNAVSWQQDMDFLEETVHRRNYFEV